MESSTNSSLLHSVKEEPAEILSGFPVSYELKRVAETEESEEFADSSSTMVKTEPMEQAPQINNRSTVKTEELPTTANDDDCYPILPGFTVKSKGSKRSKKKKIQKVPKLKIRLRSFDAKEKEKEEVPAKQQKMSDRSETAFSMKKFGGKRANEVKSKLLSLCERILMEQHSPKQRVRCGQCKKSIVMFSPNGTPTELNALHHAVSHTHMACKHCKFKSLGRPKLMLEHLKKEHGIKFKRPTSILLFIDEIDICEENQATFRAKINACFNDKVEEESESELIAYCKEVIMKYSHERYSNASCSVCRVSFRRINEYGFPRSYVILNHVMSHVDKPLFECRFPHCGQVEKCRTAMNDHLKSIHNVGHIDSSHFKDRTTYNVDRMAVKRMIDWCFGKNVAKARTSYKFAAKLAREQTTKAACPDAQVEVDMAE